MVKFLIATGLALTVVSVSAQPPVRTLQSLSFMAGQWYTTSEWGDMEQVWTKPMGDCITCVYRCVKNGKAVFYEFIVIEQMETGPVMFVRHFSPGSIGWEEKDKPWEYPLMFYEPGHVRFERVDRKTALTFRQTSDTTMTVILERQDEDGRWIEDVFEYARGEE